MGQTRPSASATVTERVSWHKVKDSVEWRPRDSAGEIVLNNKIWLLGGWFDSFEAPPRDVWASVDGTHWKPVIKSAPWKHSDFLMSIGFKNRLWVMGGWYNGRLPGHSASNKVWSSKDGKRWKLENKSAEWTPRLGAGLVEFKGKLWLLGGTENYYFGDSSSLKNDVWYSVDGVKWSLATPNAGWSPRAFHAAVVLNGKIWVMGGGNYVPFYSASNDVWNSEDGVHWVKVANEAGWSPRLWFAALNYRDCIWVLGGWSNFPSKNWNDVWYSKDGATWSELKSDSVWSPRHEHSTYVFQDRIWVMGGNSPPLKNDVWYLFLKNETELKH